MGLHHKRLREQEGVRRGAHFYPLKKVFQTRHNLAGTNAGEQGYRPGYQQYYTQRVAVADVSACCVCVCVV